MTASAARPRALPAPDPGGAPVQQTALAAEHAPAGREGYGVHVGITHLLTGATTPRIRHDVPEVVVVHSGVLDVDLDGTTGQLRAGDYFTIPAGCWHSFGNRRDEPASMIFAFGGDPGPVTVQRERPVVGSAAGEEGGTGR